MKERLIQFAKRREAQGFRAPDGTPFVDWTLRNYKPWYLELTMDKSEIPTGLQSDPCVISGEYFGRYPSMPIGPNDGYSVNGEKLPYESFRLVKTFPGTGSSLCVFEKI